MYNWHKAMNISELAENKPTEILAGDKQLCLFKRNGTVFAFAALCPHTSAPLCEGWIDARGHIVCPLHSYRFNPANGYNSSGEGYKLKTYPVEIRDNEIFVGILS
ncbi:MAG: Rieske (2Fe-2S) protein [Bacteroidetes bacterium]|nr:Rieske (2Fe-2S) protein [Bacteroidota bacterium]